MPMLILLMVTSKTGCLQHFFQGEGREYLLPERGKKLPDTESTPLVTNRLSGYYAIQLAFRANIHADTAN